MLICRGNCGKILKAQTVLTAKEKIRRAAEELRYREVLKGREEWRNEE